jgi:hypothetical protein
MIAREEKDGKYWVSSVFTIKYDNDLLAAVHQPSSAKPMY